MEDHHRASIRYKRKDVDLYILDCAGDEAFNSLRDFAITRSDCFILVYSVIDKSTFEKMQQLKLEITSKLGT